MVLLASLVVVEGVTVEEVKIGVVMLVVESVVELLSVVSVKLSVVVSPDIVDGVRVVEDVVVVVSGSPRSVECPDNRTE